MLFTTFSIKFFIQIEIFHGSVLWHPEFPSEDKGKARNLIEQIESFIFYFFGYVSIKILQKLERANDLLRPSVMLFVILYHNVLVYMLLQYIFVWE